MSWWSNVKRWFWGDLKPELQDEPVEKEQPKEITTTDKVLKEAVEVLDEAIKKTSEPEPKKQRVPRKRKPKVSEETKETEVKKAPKKRATKKPAEKPATKKPRKPRKKKESNAD